MPGGPADLAFLGGDVYTVDAARRWAEAVAVRDGRIVMVGCDADVRSFVGSGTEIVDLRGRLLLPGFQDAHVHPIGGGLNQLRCGLGGLDGAEAYLDRVASYAIDHPEAEWIVGGGWSMAAFPGGTPTRGPLDAVVPDRPVYLTNRDGHGAWVNGRALAAAGIDRHTPDPPDGRIERDARGEPSGTLHEGAMRLVGRHVPAPAPDDVREALLLAQARLNALGVTAWQDAIVGPYAFVPDSLRTYHEAAEHGELTARVVGALWWDRAGGLDQIDELLDRRARGSAGRFQATSVKIMQDGVCENQTAAVLEPYLDDRGRPTSDTGISFVDPELLAQAVCRLDREGFQVHVHAIGERAVREALDALAAARAANGLTDCRHHLAHIQVIHPDDLPRFRTLGVTANAQPLWAAHGPQMDDLTIPFLGPQRAGWQYPFASLHQSGAQLAFGSDWPVSSPNPLEEMHVAVNRSLPPALGGPAAPLLPDERVDLATALAAFTMGSAYVNHLDAQTGSIEPGKFADLTVLDRNIFAEPADAIADARVLFTTVEGTPVFSAVDL